jgi:hypothetical protein
LLFVEIACYEHGDRKDDDTDHTEFPELRTANETQDGKLGQREVAWRAIA